jgi:hypothetical protein
MSDLRPLAIHAAEKHGLGGAAVGLVPKGEEPTVECAGLAGDGDPASAVTLHRRSAWRSSRRRAIAVAANGVGIAALRRTRSRRDR